jgi:hypothetical protein
MRLNALCGLSRPAPSELLQQRTKDMKRSSAPLITEWRQERPSWRLKE